MNTDNNGPEVFEIKEPTEREGAKYDFLMAKLVLAPILREFVQKMENESEISWYGQAVAVDAVCLHFLNELIAVLHIPANPGMPGQLIAALDLELEESDPHQGERTWIVFTRNDNNQKIQILKMKPPRFENEGRVRGDDNETLWGAALCVPIARNKQMQEELAQKWQERTNDQN